MSLQQSGAVSEPFFENGFCRKLTTQLFKLAGSYDDTSSERKTNLFVSILFHKRRTFVLLQLLFLQLWNFAWSLVSCWKTERWRFGLEAFTGLTHHQLCTAVLFAGLWGSALLQLLVSIPPVYALVLQIHVHRLLVQVKLSEVNQVPKSSS